MLRIFSGISQASVRTSMLLFCILFSLSIAFFALADDSTTDKNIFQDSDQDGLSNDEEALYKTDSLNRDTDGDGYSDGVEVESGYDPLKPAPGDKLISVINQKDTTPSERVSDADTLTGQVSAQIATMVQQGTNDGGAPVTIDEVNTAVQNIMSQTDEEIVLPEVNTDDIKIKILPKKLKGDQLEEKKREDALQYLTVMAYILANNSPKKFHDKTDFSSVMTSLGIDSLTAVATGNGSFLEDISKKGEKTLKEVKDVEVPEDMLELHMKAIKIAKYSITLNEEAKKKSPSDPLGQVASLSKVQGFLGVIAEYVQELYGKMGDLGIKEIPVNL